MATTIIRMLRVRMIMMLMMVVATQIIMIHKLHDNKTVNSYNLISCIFIL